MDPMSFLGMAFITVVGMKEHPRNSAGADLEACMDLAQEMLVLYSKEVMAFEQFRAGREAAGRN